MADANASTSEGDARIAQAADAVSAQLGCSADEALMMMRDRAEIEDCSLDDVATAVLSTDFRFDEPS